MAPPRRELRLSKAEYPKRFKVCYKTKVNRKPKCVKFGDRRYENYTTHKDEGRKERYIKRHKGRENWRDISSAGFWAKHVLWNKKTVGASIKDLEKKFNIKVTKAR